MDEKLCFVQFLHPGGEHRPDDGSIKRWNTKEHRRKFLVRPGKYVAGAKLLEGEMEFWGEWEPDSRVVKSIADPIPHGPRFIYEPYYVLPESYIGLQNTDPFVFGERFHYTGCQQRTTNGSTQLRYLSRGSVILFGSCEDKSAFVLDTVFVVDRWIDHDRANYAQILRVPSRKNTCRSQYPRGIRSLQKKIPARQWDNRKRGDSTSVHLTRSHLEACIRSFLADLTTPDRKGLLAPQSNFRA
jgi:hypothetical protein